MISDNPEGQGDGGSNTARQLRIADWNLRYTNKSERLGDFLASFHPDVCTFQEVTPYLFERLCRALPEFTAIFSLDMRPPKKSEGRKRSLGCAIFAAPEYSLHRSYLLDVPFPERTAVAELSGANGSLTVASIHAPPGVSHGKLKPETFIRVADWISITSGPILFGIDANTPKFDRWDHSLNEWWWKDEPILFGDTPHHHLQDLFRLYLDENPKIAKKFRKARPHGPLAVTHRRGSKEDNRIDCRYDLIYGTDHFRPVHFDHPFQDSIKAGSDHSIVVADLEISTKSPKVYIASKTKHANKWQKLTDVNVISSWHNAQAIVDPNEFPVLWETCVRETASADLLIVYCERGETLKGCLVEIGVALAAGKPVYCIGECTSVLADNVSDASFNHHPLWNWATSVDAAISHFEGRNV